MGLLPYGLSRDATHNAILIIAMNVNSNNHKDTIQILSSMDLSNEYVVNLYEGVTTLSANSDSRLREYSEYPEIGASIGIKGASPSFSIGVYVEVPTLNANPLALSVARGLQ